MTNDQKTRKRTCLRCKQEKEINNFKSTKSIFFPGKRSLICTECLEIMIDSTDLNKVDTLMRYLDLPFDPDKWISLHDIHGDHTLSAYFNMITDDRYDSITWNDESERWRIIRESNAVDDEVSVFKKEKNRQLRERWSDAYDTEELNFLEEYYNQILATQNVSTPILQHYARDLCEIELRIKKGVRGGDDVKKDMDARDNIIKIANFTASNSKNSADFESVGELMVYYGKKGWHPKWHQEPQDSIDFIIQDNHNYLRRLVTNEGNLAEQVEDRRASFNLAERLEEEDDGVRLNYVSEDPEEFEGEDELAGELSDWNRE